jgi:hypothetical protein
VAGHPQTDRTTFIGQMGWPATPLWLKRGSSTTPTSFFFFFF